MSCTPSVNASETEKDEGTLAHVAKNIYSFVYDKGSNVQYYKHDLINWDVRELGFPLPDPGGYHEID
jgi:hypothetical protein